MLEEFIKLSKKAENTKRAACFFTAPILKKISAKGEYTLQLKSDGFLRTYLIVL